MIQEKAKKLFNEIKHLNGVLGFGIGDNAIVIFTQYQIDIPNWYEGYDVNIRVTGKIKSL